MSTDAAALRRICDECKGNMGWDAAKGQLKCASCGALRDPPAGMVGPTPGRIVEHDLEAELAAGKPKGRIGAGARQAKCGECMAVVEFPDTIQATKCEFCGSPQVLAQEARADHYQPESVVPFAIARAVAVASFQSWQGKLWFRPSNLKEKSSVSELHGVYIPYWTFDCNVHSRWTADAGYYYYETETYTTTENGKSVTRTRQVQKTRWVPADGAREDSYDDHLVCASKGVPDDLESRIGGFQTSALVVYQPQYLQGFSAESYAVELRDGWGTAQQEIAVMQERKCAGDVPGDTHRNLSVNNAWSAKTFKHVLLPLWIAAYRYDAKVYRFLVNGQTGKVAGKAPYSITKIVLFIAAIVAVIAGLVLAFKR